MRNLIKWYGVSAYDSNDNLIIETGYNIPLKWVAVMYARKYKVKHKAAAVEVHQGTKQGFYKYVGQV